MGSQRVWFPLGLCLINPLWGCGGTSSIPPVSSPFFLPTSQDTMRLATLSREVDTRALACLEASACEQIHFARALISLFENREAAGASFRRVIADNPSSTLAAASTLWLHLLENEERAADDRSPLTEITAQFVRDWLEHQLASTRFTERQVRSRLQRIRVWTSQGSCRCFTNSTQARPTDCGTPVSIGCLEAD